MKCECLRTFCCSLHTWPHRESAETWETSLVSHSSSLAPAPKSNLLTSLRKHSTKLTRRWGRPAFVTMTRAAILLTLCGRVRWWSAHRGFSRRVARSQLAARGRTRDTRPAWIPDSTGTITTNPASGCRSVHTLLQLHQVQNVLTPTFLSSSPTMLSAEILADVVRGLADALTSPDDKTIFTIQLWIHSDANHWNSCLN